MIAFDNGPRDGDYVRYIDDLLKHASIAASAGILSDVGDGSTGRTRDRAATLASAEAIRSGSELPSVLRPAAAPRAGTGFAAPIVVSPAATAAAAIASALASGQVGGAALATHTKVGLAAMAFGVVLALFGFFADPLNLMLVAGGLALIIWAVRMMRDAAARTAGIR